MRCAVARPVLCCFQLGCVGSSRAAWATVGKRTVSWSVKEETVLFSFFCPQSHHHL